SEIQFLNEENVEGTLSIVRELNEIAQKRGQSLAQMAIAWNQQQNAVISVLVGASKLSQLENNIKALDNLEFTADELAAIDRILAKKK
ncbi:MAG: aldo/keto reductase, partial [Enterococcus viikkiensis]